MLIDLLEKHVQPHVAPTTPGSIHEGGELGYSLNHAFGAAFDNPALIVACVIGDGEAENGPLATAWKSNKLAFSFARAIQQPALEIWGGLDSNTIAAQKALIHRARCNHAARRGEYNAATEGI